MPSAQANRGISIHAKGLSKRFNREWIFKNANFVFEAGNTYCVVGPNGSGKSTLLQVVWGQVPPSSGSIEYQAASGPVAIDQIYRHLSIATPYLELIEEFTLKELLDFHFRLRTARNGMRTDEMMERMYLSAARDKFISNFSSGMKQRLKLGLAFFSQSDVIFLDEPGTNLDSTALNWYREELSRLPSDMLVIIASNDPREYPESAKTIRITDFKPGRLQKQQDSD